MAKIYNLPEENRNFPAYRERAEEERRNLCDSIDRTLDCFPSLFILTDSNVEREVLPLLNDSEVVRRGVKIVIEPGEENKNPETLVRIWRDLSREGATRSSAVLNIGGGMITDLGGFAASTFKRGLPYFNLPTTLLAAVDAAFGGKTGCDLDSLKNEVGVFANPAGVILSSLPLLTLPEPEILSGIGELLKTGLIASEPLYRSLLDPSGILKDRLDLQPLIESAVEIKNRIVSEDPHEKGKRKVLNFGHTAGHAFETLLLERKTPQPHGIAVAHGLLVELILSHTLLGFPSAELYPYSGMLREWFPHLQTGCQENDRLIEIMTHDKKNRRPDRINFTLLSSIGKPEWDQEADEDEIRTALEIYRDLLGR